PHLRDRPGGAQHQQRDRDIRERVARRRQRLRGPEDPEVALPPQRPGRPPARCCHWVPAGVYLYRRPCSMVARLRSLRMSWSVRENEVRFTIGFIRCLVIDFGLANSRSPSAPWIRPNPESPDPPNGSEGTPANEITELTAVIPLCSDRAAAIAAFLFRANTADPSPYRLAVASLTPSSRSANPATGHLGPEATPLTARLSSGTSVRITGPMNGLRMLARPPTTALPPLASASAMCRSTTSTWPGRVIGP